MRTAVSRSRVTVTRHMVSVTTCTAMQKSRSLTYRGMEYLRGRIKSDSEYAVLIRATLIVGTTSALNEAPGGPIAMCPMQRGDRFQECWG